MTGDASPRGTALVAAIVVAFLVIAGAALAVTQPSSQPRPTAAIRATASTRVVRRAHPEPKATATTTRTSAPPATQPNTTTSTPTTAPHPSTTTATTSPPPSPTVATVAATAGNAVGLGAVVGKTIAIDPGHNGLNYAHPEINQLVNIGNGTRACDTTGTETNGGYTESAFNLDVSLRLASDLRAAGANVVLTRSSNEGWGPCITERAAIGNQAHAAVAISIHADGGPPDGHGFHVLYPASIPGLTAPIAATSYRLANDVRAAYHDGTGMPYATYIGNGDGLMARSDLGGLNLSTVPKVFIETGNMRNAGDAALLVDASFRQRAADAIAHGLASYLAGR